MFKFVAGMHLLHQGKEEKQI